MFGDILGALGGSFFDIAKVALPALATGVVIKHGRKLTGWIPNALIPVAGFAVGTAAGIASTGSVETGIALGVKAALGGVGIHQVVKVGLQGAFGRLTGALGEKLNRIGPGDKISI